MRALKPIALIASSILLGAILAFLTTLNMCSQEYQKEHPSTKLFGSQNEVVGCGDGIAQELRDFEKLFCSRFDYLATWWVAYSLLSGLGIWRGSTLIASRLKSKDHDA